MFKTIKEWLGRFRCSHEYRYSRSKPGTLVCKRCRKRKPRPKA
jgi:hypothetical protein